MGILRKIGKGLGGMIFAFSIVAVLTVNALVEFTEYETMKPIFLDILQGQVERQIEDAGIIESMDIEDDEIYQLVATMCEGHDTVVVPLDQLGDFGGMDEVTVDCNDFREMPDQGMTPVEYMVDRVGEDMFDDIYYKEYDCEFIDCLKSENSEDALVVASQKGHEFFESIVMWPWICVAIGILLIGAAAETLPDFLKGLGWPMVGLGITYLFMSLLKGAMVNMFAPPEVQQAGIDLMTPVNSVIDPIVNTLMYVLMIGTVITISGYALEWYRKKYGEGPAKPTVGARPKAKGKPNVKGKEK